MKVKVKGKGKKVHTPSTNQEEGCNGIVGRLVVQRDMYKVLKHFAILGRRKKDRLNIL